MDALKKATRYISDGCSVREAAIKVGVPITTLHRHLKKVNVVSGQQKTLKFNSAQKNKSIGLRKQGLSYLEISKRTQVPVTTIKSWCSSISLNEKQKKLNLGAEVKKQELAIKYRKQGMFIGEIAKKLGCAKSSVSLWLSKIDDQDLHSVVNSRKLNSSVKHQRVIEKVSKRQASSKSNKNSSFSSKKNQGYEDFIRIIVEKRFNGMSFNEISRDLGIHYTTAASIFKKQNFSKEKLEDVRLKCKEHANYRRKNGELKPVGGVREGSGRAKTGYYKGIYCGSTYELCWVIHALDHGVGFKRFEGSLKKDRITYVPDFLLDDNTTIIELKGYEHDDRVQKKTEVAESFGYTVHVLRKEDLAFAFDHVKEKYGVSAANSYTLYDDFKPQFEYTCKQCKKVFHKNHKPKIKNKGLFCSNICSGKFNIGSRIKSGSFKPVPPHIRKITDEQVIEIFKEPGLHREIAERYGVSKALVGLIKNKKVRQDILGNI